MTKLLCRLGIHRPQLVRAHDGEPVVVCSRCGRYVAMPSIYDVRVCEGLYVLVFTIIAIILIYVRQK